MMKVMTCVVALASEAEQCNYYVLNTSEKYSKGLYKINVQVLICVYAYTYMLARDVPDIHPVPGKCQVSHYSVLPGPGKIKGPNNNKKKIFFFFLNFFFTRG